MDKIPLAIMQSPMQDSYQVKWELSGLGKISLDKRAFLQEFMGAMDSQKLPDNLQWSL